MKGIAFATAAQGAWSDTYGAPTCRAEGTIACAPAEFPGFPLWALRAEMGGGSQLVWGEDHGDEALYVESGLLEIDGRQCPGGGSVIVEAGVRAALRAVHPTKALHVGPHDMAAPTAGYYGAPAPDGHGVHVVGPGGTWAALEPGRQTRMFADSTCDTCRITFFLTSRDELFVAQPHRHSTDEILYVLAGEVHFGAYRLQPGDAVAVAAHQRYGFRSGPDGFAFLNYRRDASEQTTGEGPPRLEGGAARGLTPVHDVR